MSDKRIVNEYLYHEFGHDFQQDPSAIADDWPFELKMAGTICSTQGTIDVFEFITDGEVHFALSGHTLTFYPVAGMILDDLQLQEDGTRWIARQGPVDLATSRIGDASVPSAVERRGAIEGLAADVCDSPRILEGLYLRTKGTYLVLVEDTHTGTVMVVARGLEPHTIDFPQASSWRRLALGVGKMLRKGILK